MMPQTRELSPFPSGKFGIIDASMVTLQDVAEKAGVHVTTASAALNGGIGNTRVGQKTREEIQKIAAELGYVRNEAAHRLRTGKSNVLGFGGGDLRNPFFNELAAQLESEFHRRGFHLLITHVAPGDRSDTAKSVETLRQQSVRMVVLWQEDFSETSRFDSGCKVLPVGFTRQPRPGIWLDIDRSIGLAVSDLKQRGYRELGFFYPSLSKDSPSVAERIRSFQRHCTKHGLPAPVLEGWPGESWDFSTAVQHAQSLRIRRKGPVTWIGFNDVAALAIANAEPSDADFPLVSFDNTALLRCSTKNTLIIDIGTSELVRRICEYLDHSMDSALPPGNKAQWIQPSLPSQMPLP